MKATAVLGSVRQFGTVAIVAGIGGVYAGFLVMCSAMLTASSEANGSEGIGALLAVVATVFILIAIYVAAVVTVNCIDTVLAGMLHRIALLRLLGASASSLRAVVTRRTTLLAAAAASLGVLFGALATTVLRMVLVGQGDLSKSADYALLNPWLVAPVLAITAASYFASRIGARGVLRVAPAAAMLGASAGGTPTARPGRLARAALVAIAIGAALLLWSMQLGEKGGTSAGLLVAFFGAATMGTGLLLGARLVIPAAVAGLGRLLGNSPESRIARRNALKNPLRTTRATMGLVIGVTLVTTFAAGMDALRRSVYSWETSPEQQREALSTLSTATAILLGVIVVSALIAAVGFVSTMSLSVLERTREIGLLRALGFTRSQVRSMIVRESAALACSAVLLGVALGLFFGAAGAQALIGFETPGFVWGRPWPILATITAAATGLVLVAASVPARRAVLVTPVAALRQ